MNILTQILENFTEIGEWFVSIINIIIGLFWTTAEGGGSLTVLGVLAIITLGIGLITMVIAMIRSFFKGRG